MNLTSPLYPENYPNFFTCEYTIVAPDGYKVLAEFLDFDTELGWDYFYIGDSQISGTDPPDNYTSIDETLTIRFQADESYAMRGYVVQLSFIDVTGM